MNRTMCPGQDTRYWRPDDIFTVPCGSCGAQLEFFKDDAARRCAKCGTRVRNPRLSMGCAQWCQHAKECLGYDPREAAGEGTVNGRSVVESIIDELNREFGPSNGIVYRSISAYERSRPLVEREAADPAVVFPAVLLLMVDAPIAKRIMEEAGVERSALLEACDLIGAYHAGISGIGAGPGILRAVYNT